MSNNKSIRVLIADDHFVVRTGLSTLINSEPDMTVIAEAIDGKQAADLYRSTRPDVVVMDLRMPVMNGVEAIIAIQREFTDSRIVILTTYDGDEDIYRALQAGARAYILKDTVGDELTDTIRAVHAGQRRIPAGVAARLAERMPRSELTPRELEVLHLIVGGKSNKEIAAALFVTEGTIKIHVNNLLSKLGVADRTQAVMAALQRGIVHLD